MSAYPAGFDGKAFEACQEKILSLNEDHQKAVSKIEIDRDVATNAVYAARAAVIKAKGPKNFWGQVILAHKDMQSGLIGSYDAKIFEHLVDYNVAFRPDGAIRLEMTFEKNPYFKEERLFVEESIDRELTFGGITWNEGFGPYTPEEEIAMAEAEEKAGAKRPRDESENRGQTMLQFFSVVPIDPLEAIPESDALNEDEVEDILEEFKEMLEDRKELFRAMVTEIWAFPTKILKTGSA